MAEKDGAAGAVVVKCWGYNGHGQLGAGDSVARGRDESQMGDNLPVVELGADM